ncbi:MAG: arsenate reductase ArsC [Verrucomicrobiota bacterium]
MSQNEDLPLVLILCTGNSCRSQMAEAFLRRAAGGALRVESAGSKPSGYVHPLSVRAMGEVGIDISDSRSKSLEEFKEKQVDTVITVCGNADQDCPTFQGQRHRYHWPFDDPADAQGDEEEQLEVFRRVREQVEMMFSAYGLGRKDALVS